jgi:hypothetical protein
MKKLLLLLLTPIFIFGQDESFNNAVNNKIYNKIVSTGNSQFTISVTKGKELSLPISFEKLQEIGLNKIEEFCKLNSYTYKIINIDKQRKSLPRDARVYDWTTAAIITGDSEWIKLGGISSFINSQKQKILTLTFNISSKDGDFTMSKEQARIELIKLKELLDLDIITKSEFENRAMPLKKIVLKSGN